MVRDIEWREPLRQSRYHFQEDDQARGHRSLGVAGVPNRKGGGQPWEERSLMRVPD